ncbi:MAG: hypothetical protein Q4G03_11960 [Planctomycetia bacterium]|nr:hypothetical protein [Planctomycetia bacterium]
MTQNTTLKHIILSCIFMTTPHIALSQQMILNMSFQAHRLGA